MVWFNKVKKIKISISFYFFIKLFFDYFLLLHMFNKSRNEAHQLTKFKIEDNDQIQMQQYSVFSQIQTE
jgi:hypothetical protein